MDITKVGDGEIAFFESPEHVVRKAFAGWRLYIMGPVASAWEQDHSSKIEAFGIGKDGFAPAVELRV